MNASYILDNLPSLCQKLSHLVDVWRNYNKNNFACFFETQCIVFALEHLRLLTRGIMSEIGQVTWALRVMRLFYHTVLVKCFVLFWMCL